MTLSALNQEIPTVRSSHWAGLLSGSYVGTRIPVGTVTENAPKYFDP